jgi:uncharacterized membrane protein
LSCSGLFIIVVVVVVVVVVLVVVVVVVVVVVLVAVVVVVVVASVVVGAVSADNSHATKESHFQANFSVNTWCGVIGNLLFGPSCLKTA